MKVEKWNPNLQTYDDGGIGAITINDLSFVNEAFDWNNTEGEEYRRTIQKKRWIEKRDFDGDEKVDFHEFIKFSILSLHQDRTEIEESFSDSLADESPKPTDGGWGWMVVFACIMCNFIVGKFRFSFKSF